MKKKKIKEKKDEEKLQTYNTNDKVEDEKKEKRLLAATIINLEDKK